jgi:hypothetical protein
MSVKETGAPERTAFVAAPLNIWLFAYRCDCLDLDQLVGVAQHRDAQ